MLRTSTGSESDAIVATIVAQIRAEHKRLLLPPRAAAKVAGISEDEMYDRTNTGEIPTIRVGRRSHFVPIEALVRWAFLRPRK